MPKFTFECKCGLSFTRVLPLGNHKTYLCPSCKEEAPRVLESFGFNFAEGGKAPGNSGVSKHDYPSADQVVGSDADKRWGIYNEREKVKKQVRQVGGHRALVRKNGSEYIEYSAGNQGLVEDRKKTATELGEILRRPAV
jgi:hypothetical protein